MDCLLEVKEWMDANLLKLDNEKRELVLFVSRQLGQVTLDGLNVCDIIVRSQDFAKDLGGAVGFPDDDDQSNCKRVQNIYMICTAASKYHVNWKILIHYNLEVHSPFVCVQQIGFQQGTPM